MQGGTLYILQSQETKKFYVGSTVDLERRLADHKRGNTRTTRIHIPWFLVYTEMFASLKEARTRERQIKKWKSHLRVAEMIDCSAGRAAPTL
ncbi:MAG TPA: endonuclease [Candidatus Magasanikbacteria bacterium]|nr:MAG: Excinuclease ABC C subunit domain protein [Candidatus Magasanikbacteria bacterium GW2011_GWC2_42_27]KKT25593.1 MAG: Excinuclease ABC C subunit domain protein [Candidatus Magasanikbacteria bacterium GW2011_GWA2_43_9]HCC13195.1 endonuclease [Candidatus Magasanikbacteria bacterium]